MRRLTIALSGASYSGKTTKMKELKSIYKDGLLLSDEVIRSTNINISDVRSNASDYLKFELEVIKRKIENDFNKHIQAQKDNKILLIDRSIFDSMTYFYLYMKPSDLSEEDLKKFSEFDEYLYKEAIPFYNDILNGIFLFKPLKINQEIIKKDQYRQENLNHLQNVEYNMIKSLTYAHFKKPLNEVEAITWNTKKQKIFDFNWV